MEPITTRSKRGIKSCHSLLSLLTLICPDTQPLTDPAYGGLICNYQMFSVNFVKLINCSLESWASRVEMVQLASGETAPRSGKHSMLSKGKEQSLNVSSGDQVRVRT